MKFIILKLISFYQHYFSSSTHFLVRSFGLTEAGCRFNPRCSEYTYQAIDKYGLFKGIWLGLKRVVKCHPGSKGGEDSLF